jgi:hypothetical protein
LSNWIKKARFNNLLSTKNSPHKQSHTQTKSERMEKDLPGTWKLKGCRSSYSQTRQSRFYTKIRQKRQTRSQHANKGNNPVRIYNNSKYICSKHQWPQAHKTNTSEPKGTDRFRYNNSGRSKHPTLINRQNIQTKI